MKLWSSKGRRKEKDTNSAAASRILTFFDLLIIGFGSSVGVGISVVIGGVIKNTAGPAVVGSFFLAGVAALLGGLCYSEFGARFIKANSVYAYSYFWGRENAAFIFGWILILEYLAGTASAAKGIITFIDALTGYKISDFLMNVVSTNLGNVFPYFDFFSLGIIVVITNLIWSGLKDFWSVKKIFTICNVVLVVSVITAGAFKADVNNWKIEKAPSVDFMDGFAPFGALGIVKGAAVAFYGFVGFDRIGASGIEVKQQKKVLPTAILLTIFVALLVHAGVGAVLTLMLPYDKINPDAAVPYAFQELGWTAIKWIVAVATFFGFQTSLFGAMFPLPGIIHEMANDGLLFPCLGNSCQKSQIPVTATMTGGLLAAAASGIFTFQKLVNLAVVGALFSYTILAINVILVRYSPKSDDYEIPPDSWKNFVNKNMYLSVETVIKNFLICTDKPENPTDLTSKIIAGNVIIFCVASVGLGVIFNFFYDSLTRYTPEAVVPAIILLCVMLFNLISMTCQPKSEEVIPFKVPLIPFLPCLSIFLNIFLLLTFESLTWIIFTIWMLVGIFPHFVWRLIKCSRGEVGENSLYEINRTNAIKLNKSIWKIKLDKKNFYAGAMNPVFSDDLEEMSGDNSVEVKRRNEKSLLQLKEAEIIQTAELVLEEKAEPLGSELDVNFIRVSSTETVHDLPDESGKVHWRCVAEIHTEEDFRQESVALELVDDTYNFLQQVATELAKEDGTLTSPEFAGLEKVSPSEPENFLNGINSSVAESPPSQLSEKQYETPCSVILVKNKAAHVKDKAKLKINNTNNKHFELNSRYSSDTENLNKTILKEDYEVTENPLVDEFSEKSTLTGSDISVEIKEVGLQNKNKAHKDGTTSPTNLVTTLAVKTAKDDQNKVKEFKEKLNQLLKNHVHSDKASEKNSKSMVTDDADANDGNNEEALFDNVKTLNKSEIKGKLELILSRGPPKRPSLRNSFNIKINQTDNENAKDEKAEIQNETTSNRTDGEKQFAASSLLQESIKEKILALRTVHNEGSKDVCC